MQIKNSFDYTPENISQSNKSSNVGTNKSISESGEFVSSEASKASRAYSYPQISKSKNPTFEGSVEKTIHSIVGTKNIKKLHLSFSEIINVVKRLGYEIRHNGTSHCKIEVPGQRPIVLATHGHGDVHPGVIDAIRDLIYYKHTELIT